MLESNNRETFIISRITFLDIIDLLRDLECSEETSSIKTIGQSLKTNIGDQIRITIEVVEK